MLPSLAQTMHEWRLGYYLKKFWYGLIKHWKTIIFVVVFFSLSLYFLGLIFTILIVLVFIIYYIYSICDSLLYNPNLPADSRYFVDCPRSYGVDYENHFVISEDKVTIHLQFIKLANSDERLVAPTVIYLHGNAGNIGHRLINAIQLFQKVKCNVLMVEYRGYGLSSGHPSEQGLYRDTCAALRFLRNRTDICQTKIVFFGRSLGGAVALGTAHLLLSAASDRLGLPYALIVENTFTSVPEISRHLFSHGGEDVPVLTRFVNVIPNWFYKSRYDSCQKIEEITLPTLFISGLSDELVPPSMMAKLFNKSSAIYKELHTFESGSHNFTWRCPHYYSVIDDFLKRVPEGVELYMPKRATVRATDEMSPLILAEEEVSGSTAEMPVVREHLVVHHAHNECKVMPVMRANPVTPPAELAPTSIRIDKPILDV